MSIERYPWLEAVEFDPLEGPVERWILDDVDSEMLERWTRRLFEEFTSRQELAKDKLRRPLVAPNPWLKPILYKLILRYAYEERLDELDDRLERHGGYSHRQGGPGALFMRGTRALVAHAPEVMSRNLRNRMAREMWHGFRNYVPPHLLNSFNRQYRSASIASDESEATLVRDFYPIIIDERANWRTSSSELEELRGKYPVWIETVSRTYSDNHDEISMRSPRNKPPHNRDENFDQKI